MADEAKSRRQVEREARLEQALRANLRRRKAQARARSLTRDQELASAEAESGEDLAGRRQDGSQ